MGNTVVKTTRFGEISVDESLILSFEEPILGFDGIQRYVILDHADNSPFKWLQAVGEDDLAFVVTNPKLFGLEYEFVLPGDIATKLGITNADDALVLTIVNIPQGDPGKMTANLLGPIVINQSNRKALQVVLADSPYDTKTRLIPDETLSKTASASRGKSEG